MNEINNAHHIFESGLKLLSASLPKNTRRKTIKHIRQMTFDLKKENRLLNDKTKSTERYRDAIHCFEQTIRINPQFRPAWLALAYIYSGIRHNHKAYMSIYNDLMISYAFYNEQATHNDVYFDATLIIRIVVANLIDNGDFNNAIEICNEQLGKAPVNYGFASQKAFALELQGLFNEAIKYYKLAMEQKEDCNRNIIRVAVCYYAIGEYHRSINMYEQALKLNCEPAIALIGIGDCYMMLNMHDEALQSYMEADDIENTENNVKEHLISLGDDLFENDKFNEAIQTYLQALSGNSNDDLVYLYIGFCSLLLDRKDDAIAYFQEAKKVNKTGQISCEYVENLIP